MEALELSERTVPGKGGKAGQLLGHLPDVEPMLELGEVDEDETAAEVEADEEVVSTELVLAPGQDVA